MVEWVSITFGVLGILFGANCYYHLWRWARDCQHARIAIARKRKVVLQAPLVEWLLWCRRAKKDNQGFGQVVFSSAGISVAVIQPNYPPGRIKKWLAKRKKKEAVPRTGNEVIRRGTWSARDETIQT